MGMDLSLQDLAKNLTIDSEVQCSTESLYYAPVNIQYCSTETIHRACFALERESFEQVSSVTGYKLR